MLFFMHSTFSLELIALVAGVALLIFIKSQNKMKKAWGIFVAWVVIILSVLSLFCSIFHVVRFWYDGGPEMYRHMMKQNMMERRYDNMQNKEKNNMNSMMQNQKHSSY